MHYSPTWEAKINMENGFNVARRVIIIGYGNIMRGDDGLGIAVVQKTQELFKQRQDGRLISGRVVLRTAPYLDLALAEEVLGYDIVILVDAILDGSREDVRLVDLSALDETSTLSTHASSPLALVSLLKTVYGTSPAFYLVAVTGEQDSLGEKLSARARRGMKRAVTEILRIVDGGP